MLPSHTVNHLSIDITIISTTHHQHQQKYHHTHQHHHRQLSIIIPSCTVIIKSSITSPYCVGDRLVSAFLPLVLDASSSFDPDTLQTTGLHYHWDCFDVAAPTSPCPFSAPLAEDKAVVTIPASSLVGGKSYVFGVTVHKDDKATTVTVTIVVVANFTVPQVGVEVRNMLHDPLSSASPS